MKIEIRKDKVIDLNLSRIILIQIRINMLNLLIKVRKI